MTVLFCSTAVDESKVLYYPSAASYEPPQNVRGRGGTHFYPVFDYIRDKKIHADLVIYITDLECNAHELAGYEEPPGMVWLCTNRLPMPDRTDGWGWGAHRQPFGKHIQVLPDPQDLTILHEEL